ncbi:MAG TPA: T9SS type A sorting domain-containing protein [bacterium]|nr:T9SS type A sorting domain-containing protein [bacterium]
MCIRDSNFIWSVAVDPYNVKWFGTKGGVSSFDGSTWTTYTTEDGLVDNDVTAIAVDADNVKWFGTRNGVSSFNERPDSVEKLQDIPAVMDIQGNFPNPFNPRTTISFSIPEKNYVTLSVYDITGQKVATLIDKHMSAGSHSVRFDGSDFASGVYLYRLESEGFSKKGKMLLMK